MKILVAALALSAGLGSVAHADALRSALDHLQERYESTKSMTADFTQMVESKTLAGALETKGRVWFQKPNRMRWDYEPPDRQLIVGDGSFLWIYQPDEKQVIKTPLDQAFQARTPTNFLAGLGQVEKDFDASLEREESDRWILKLVPKQEQAIGTLLLAVRKTDASVAEARISDPLGTVTTLRLTNERRNQDLDGDLFHFTVPAGVDVVRPPSY